MDLTHAAPTAVPGGYARENGGPRVPQPQPPLHIQQSHHYRPMTSSSSFLLVPGGVIDSASTQGGGKSVATNFFFSPFDMSNKHPQHSDLFHAQQQQGNCPSQYSGVQAMQTHGLSHHLADQRAGHRAISGGSTPSMTSLSHTPSVPPTGSSANTAGFSPHPSQFPYFGQV